MIRGFREIMNAKRRTRSRRSQCPSRAFQTVPFCRRRCIRPGARQPYALLRFQARSSLTRNCGTGYDPATATRRFCRAGAPLKSRLGGGRAFERAPRASRLPQRRVLLSLRTIRTSVSSVNKRSTESTVRAITPSKATCRGVVRHRDGRCGSFCGDRRGIEPACRTLDAPDGAVDRARRSRAGRILSLGMQNCIISGVVEDETFELLGTDSDLDELAAAAVMVPHQVACGLGLAARRLLGLRK
jgi:hypothetical protein